MMVLTLSIFVSVIAVVSCGGFTPPTTTGNHTSTHKLLSDITRQMERTLYYSIGVFYVKQINSSNLFCKMANV